MRQPQRARAAMRKLVALSAADIKAVLEAETMQEIVKTNRAIRMKRYGYRMGRHA